MLQQMVCLSGSGIAEVRRLDLDKILKLRKDSRHV
jgi:hypothetical protein